MLITLLSGAVASLVILRHRISAKAEAIILHRLSERGLHIAYESRGWLPWRGLTFKEVKLYRPQDVNEPLLALSNLSAELSWSEIWNERVLTSRWHTTKARLTLRDNQGPLTLDEVSADVQVTAHVLNLTRLHVRQGAVTAVLAGEIHLPVRTDDGASSAGFKPGAKNPLPTIDLSGVRTVLHQLDLDGPPDSLTLEGTGTLDLTSTPRAWRLSLHGTGGGFQWRGIPVQSITGSVEADQESWGGEASLSSPHGNLQATFKHERRSDSTSIAGEAVDTSGRTSRFDGQWEHATKSLKIHRVTGHADWLALARTLPAVSKTLPRSLVIRRFPGLHIEDLTWRQGKPLADSFRVGSVRLTTPAAISISVRSHPLEITELTGRASFDGRRWQLRQWRGKTLGGSMSLDGLWTDRVLSSASLTGESLQLAAMTPWLGSGGERLDGATARFEYRGQLGTDSRLATGRGSVRLDQAPLVEIPLLDQTYRFFTSVIPGGPPPGSGRMTATFDVERGVMRLMAFEANSQAVVVTGSGTLDFPRQVVEARARGELRGVAGWATQPISRALEMNITGPLTQPRITAQNPVGIAGGLIQGTAEAAADALQLPGQVIERAASFPRRLWRSLKQPERAAD